MSSHDSGILKTEIHPTLPKVTVTGNVGVQTLIKRLAKFGKSAEIWPSPEKPAPEKEEKKCESTIKETAKMNNHQKEINAKHNSDEEDKSVSNSGNDHNSNKAKIREKQEDDIKINTKTFDEATNMNIPEEIQSAYQNMVTAAPPVNCLVNPGTMPPYVQGYYPMQPIGTPMAVPYYAMNMNNAYSAPPPFHAYSDPPPFCIHDHCRCQLQANHPPTHAQSQQATGFADYFNEDNTVGCHVM